MSFHNIRIWVADNPHITMASRHQHWLSIKVWVGILRDQLLGPVALPNRLMRCSMPSFFGEWTTNTLGTHVSSSTTTHVVHAWWRTTSLSPHC
jgi:hypothetical protein